MLKVKIVSTRVRTAACARTQRQPSAISSLMLVVAAGSRPCGGSAMRVTSTAPKPTRIAWPRNGRAIPSANSAAPMGGPASWLMVTKPAMIRALARGRSSRATSIGSNVADALSANTSAVASRNSASSTAAMDTLPVRMETTSRPRTMARDTSAAMTIR